MGSLWDLGAPLGRPPVPGVILSEASRNPLPKIAPCDFWSGREAKNPS